jgi:hypothetical protein
MALYLADSPLLYLDRDLGKRLAELGRKETTWTAVLSWARQHEDYALELYDEVTVLLFGLHRDWLVEDANTALSALEAALGALADIREALKAQSIAMLQEALMVLKPALQTLRHELRSDDVGGEGGSRVPVHPKLPSRPAGEARTRPTFIEDPAE